MADNIRTLAVRTVQDLENHDATRSCWRGSAVETLIENSISTPVRHLRRFHPLDGLHRCAIVGFRHPMEILSTVVVIEDLTRLGKQRLDVFPDPLGPVTDNAEAHLLFWNQASLLDLLESLAPLLLISSPHKVRGGMHYQ